MSPFQNALAAQTQLAGDVGRLGAQQFGVLSSRDQQQKYAQAGIDAMANETNYNSMLLTSNLVLLVNRFQV